MAENTKNVKALSLNEKDVDALKHVYNLLVNIQGDYDREDILMSPVDGELIKVDELARVRGILSFLYNNTEVEVNP